MRVVFVTPEIPPFSKSGRAGRVFGGASAAARAAGVDISLIVPRHRMPDGGRLEAGAGPSALSVPMNGDRVKAGVYTAGAGAFPFFWSTTRNISSGTGSMGRPAPVTWTMTSGSSFSAGPRPSFLGTFDPPADVIHCHDWPTALLPVFLKTHYREVPALRRAASVLTIHNAAEQGEFPPESLAWTGLNWDFFKHGRLNLNGKFNFLKAGIAYSDLVNANGAALGRALLKDKGGQGLDGALRERGESFAVIPPGTGPAGWEETAGIYIELYQQSAEN